MHDHKKWVSGVFDRAASEYGTKSSAFFNYFGKRLADQIYIAPGQRLLDVATGRGAVLFPLAESVGSSGNVIGVDMSQEMLKETAKDAGEKKIEWIELRCMDAECLDFSDHYFDHVFCGFALFFLPSLSTALSEFMRVLKTGGKLAVSIWGESSELKTWLMREIQKLCNTNSLAATPLPSGHVLQTVLESVNFQNVRIYEETKKFLHHTSQEWWDSLWAHGSRAQLEQLSFSQLEYLRNQAMKKAEELDQGHGIIETLRVIYGVGEKH